MQLLAVAGRNLLEGEDTVVKSYIQKGHKFVFGYEGSMFLKMFHSFLVYMFWKFSAYDFKGYWYWNTSEKAINVKDY